MSNANMDGNGNNKHIIIITIIRSGVGWRVVFFGFLLDGWIAFQQKPPKKKRRRRRRRRRRVNKLCKSFFESFPARRNKQTNRGFVIWKETDTKERR